MQQDPLRRGMSQQLLPVAWHTPCSAGSQQHPGDSSALRTAAPLGTAVPWGQQHSEDSSALGMAAPSEQQRPRDGSTLRTAVRWGWQHPGDSNTLEMAP